ncbi:alpha/beta hydrolase family protein [Acinetobacter rongchengensis]|uniref:Alpha/beta fold hydrolase n=1 Tax=Acinetobacter rongchengensis TaxID=2419601 RepID=A0A3A8F2V5_9GAMM|nr:alpha/beta fold hydrolase [Acinetobacter rongchengensis]RKG40096.1 alpha/beta fold hydrolase [Acinetobacter rongchengensis]
MQNLKQPANTQDMDIQAFKTETISFQALDGYHLIGTLYTPKEHTKAQIVLSSATGVPQAFYRRFAEYAAQLGYQTFTFDYRGVSQSAPKTLKGFQMSYLDWGKFDLTAAIDYLAQDDLPLFLVGHSYGGQALGLTTNHHKVTAMYCFGTGAGWHGYMPLKEKIKVQVIWNIVFPPMVAAVGYLPWSKLNMGADLPKGVYSQWRKWCKNPTYFFADPEQHHLHDQYAQVTTPIYAVAALDDDWALPRSRYAFMQHYRHAPMNFINISADEFGLKKIGHMGYFRKGSEAIWDKMLNTFEDLLHP